MAYTDAEIRQGYEVMLIGRPVSRAPRVNDEASDVHWVQPSGLDDLDIHSTLRRQTDLYLDGGYPHVD